MKTVVRSIQRSFSSRKLFFFLWVLVYIVAFALQGIMRDDFRTMTYILHDVPHFGGIGWHWTFWVHDKLGRPWDKAAYLFVGTVKRTMIYIILGKLQYLLLRQQGYRDKWWMLMTLIAPLVASIPDLITFTLVMPFIGWLALFIDIPISFDVIREMTRIASGLGFGSTQ